MAQAVLKKLPDTYTFDVHGEPVDLLESRFPVI